MKANIVSGQQGNNSATPSPTGSLEPKVSSTPNTGGIPTASPRPTGPPPPNKSKAPGLIETNPNVNSTVWREVAINAWSSFQPGLGVDPETGLPYAGGTDFKAFTDWDLGAYIQAIIDAQEIGVIAVNGTWGSCNRINMVLTFLENRPLNATTNWPFWFYNATDGQGFLENSTYASDSINIVDTGALLVALNNLRIYNYSLTARIDNFVWNVNDNRSNYSSLVPSIMADASSNGIYGYYCWSGFASFWPNQLSSVPSQIMTNIENSPTVITFNVKLPDTAITCEPLLLSIFELNNSNPELMNLMKQVYAAQEAYYEATGVYAAWSEGSSPGNGYVYEWVVAPNGRTWQITNSTTYYFNDVSPVIFTKVAYGFLALYNSTYAENMVIALEKALPAPTNGYYGGMDTSGTLETGTPSSETNSLILDAALYYIQNNPNN